MSAVRSGSGPVLRGSIPAPTMGDVAGFGGGGGRGAVGAGAGKPNAFGVDGRISARQSAEEAGIETRLRY
jgi:hypothetical protein